MVTWFTECHSNIWRTMRSLPTKRISTSLKKKIPERFLLLFPTHEPGQVSSSSSRQDGSAASTLPTGPSTTTSPLLLSGAVGVSITGDQINILRRMLMWVLKCILKLAKFSISFSEKSRKGHFKIHPISVGSLSQPRPLSPQCSACRCFAFHFKTNTKKN